MTALNGRVVDLDQLQTELAAAGIAIPNGLILVGDNLLVVAVNGATNDLPPNAAPILAAHVPSVALHDAIVTVAQSAVGVTLGALTQAQRLALVAVLLYRAGALDKATLQVKPLATWAFPPATPSPILPPPLP